MLHVARARGSLMQSGRKVVVSDLASPRGLEGAGRSFCKQHLLLTTAEEMKAGLLMWAVCQGLSQRIWWALVSGGGPTRWSAACGTWL